VGCSVERQQLEAILVVVYLVEQRQQQEAILVVDYDEWENKPRKRKHESSSDSSNKKPKV
jgi:hypothetical protein